MTLKPRKALAAAMPHGELKDLGDFSRVLTPDTAVEVIETALKPYVTARLNVKWAERGDYDKRKLLKVVGNPVDSNALLDSFKAPREYTGLDGSVRPYSFPGEFNLLLLEPPTYNLAWGRIPMFSWTLGIGKTVHDPKSGEVSRYWNSGLMDPPESGRSLTDIGKGKDPQKYPTWYPTYDGDEPTCWMKCRLILPEKSKPIVFVCGLQNTVLRLEDGVIREFKRLMSKADDSWGRHYRRVIKSYEGNKDWSPPYSFGYPNRSLLLPLTALRLTERLGAEELAMKGKTDERPIYRHAFDLLERCKTQVKPVWWEDIVGRRFKR